MRAAVPLSIVLCALHVFSLPLSSEAGLPRASVQKQLEQLPGRHLAIVRYSPGHNPTSIDWVYNAADIDGAKVVWAREMTPVRDRELIDYFAGRQVWLVKADHTPPEVLPYVSNDLTSVPGSVQ